jgi:hypothetical protein
MDELGELTARVEELEAELRRFQRFSRRPLILMMEQRKREHAARPQ